MHSSVPQKLLDVLISQLSNDGHGLGFISHPDGRQLAVEVPFTIPGDQVKILLKHKYKRVYQSKIVEWIQPSHDRILPRCIHFGSCGGCRWQHLSYAHQLKIKEDTIKKLLAPYLNGQTVIHPILASEPWQYRNKMEFSFSSDQKWNHYLGLMLSKTRGHVFQLTECHLVFPWFVDLVKAVRRWWKESSLDAYHSGKDTGSLRTLTVREGRRTGDRLVMLTVSGNANFSLNKAQMEGFIAFVRDAIEPIHPNQQLSIFIRIQQIAKGHPTNFYEMHLYGPDHIRETLSILRKGDGLPLNLTFKISPTAFFQPNTRQAEIIYEQAMQLVDIPSNSMVYDLYCGTGALSLCAASYAKEVIGIELVPEAVLDARENIKNNGFSNVTIHAGDVGQVLAKLKENRQEPQLVMVDPPRSGLDAKALQHLIQLQAPKILYISCNPVTQALNLSTFVQAGYQVESIQPIDQFPQTIHVENIVVLKRS
jgi:23S rRNA (uracil1939-C5)-methyltransferase